MTKTRLSSFILIFILLCVGLHLFYKKNFKVSFFEITNNLEKDKASKTKSRVLIGTYCKGIKLLPTSYFDKLGKCKDENICSINKGYDMKIKSKAPGKIDVSSLSNKISIVIKTSGRYSHVMALLESVWKIWNNMSAVVVDDFNLRITKKFLNFTEFHKSKVQFIMLEDPNAGISIGRNEGTRLAKTEYILYLDDDFVFNHRTNITQFYEILQSTDTTLVGGEHQPCAYNGIYGVRTRGSERDLVLITGYVYEELIGYPSCYRMDVTKNIFLIRKADMEAIGGWNSAFKTEEHPDIFLKLKIANKKVVSCVRNVVDHNTIMDWSRKMRLSTESTARKIISLSWNCSNFKIYSDISDVFR